MILESRVFPSGVKDGETRGETDLNWTEQESVDPQLDGLFVTHELDSVLRLLPPFLEVTQVALTVHLDSDSFGARHVGF